MKLIIAILLCSSFLLGGTSVGTVTSLKGGARIFTKGIVSVQDATSSSNLDIGQTIKTRLNGEVGIRFVDQTKILVGPNSFLEILDLKKLSIGGSKVLFKISKQSDLKGLSIVTPTAIIGVKGTTFLVHTEGKNASIFLKEGEISVASPEGKFKSYLTSTEEEFREYKEGLQKEYEQYIAEFTMKAGMAISIHGDEVRSEEFSEAIKAEFEMLDTI
jgi:hypothetical protein